MLRVGIVAEGPSDWMVLEEVMKSIHPDIDFVRLQPDERLSERGRGWSGVQAWCRDNGSTLELILDGGSSRPIDIVVIHADCSMAHNAGSHAPVLRRLKPPSH